MKNMSIRLAIVLCWTAIGAASCAVQAVDAGDDGAFEAPPAEQLSTVQDAVKLETPVEQEATPDDSLGGACYTTTCTPGQAGDQYCTSICGDVAKCFSGGYGCGPRPCCVLM